jgi:hypothetical protein
MVNKWLQKQSKSTFFFDLAKKKIFFSAVAYSANTKISGNQGQYKAQT